ncbi:MAG TPA: hypothetical protein ENN80_12410, partial [Candidatus Hydrogenedentes bacterium]|nr:hypothetical protein [Candidatus Hydrogenedentota bacterium]
MSQILAIFRAKLRMAGHEIAGVRNQSKLKVVVIAVFATGLWGAAFLFFFYGFNWLITFGQASASGSAFNIGDIIMARMLGILGLAVFFMLIFSNVLIAFSTLYRSHEVPYLLQAPLPFRAYYVARFWECVGFSSWALAFLGSPLMIAYGITTNAPWSFYIMNLVFFVPFITIPASLGAILTMVLARIFPRQRMRVFFGLGIIAVLLLFLYVQDALNVSRLSQDAVLAALMDATAQTQSAFLPSYWATRGVLAAATHDYRECLFQFLILASNACFLVWLGAEVAHRIFYQGYSYLLGQEKTRLKPLGKGVLGRMDALMRWLPNPTRALVIKDIRLFWR